MKAWENFLEVQQAEIGAETVAKWLKPLKILRFDACNLYLQAQDAFHVMWFEEHIRHKLQTHLFNNNGRRIRVHISLPGKEGTSSADRGLRKKPIEAPKAPPFSLNFDELDPYNTLENLVVFPGNELVHNLLCELVGYDPKEKGYTASKGLNSDFNPIYIYGGGGCGKSHLLQAAAHGLKKQGYRVLYVRSETFTEHVVKAIRAGEMRTFRQAYRSADCLLLDDVHVLARKGATQEELFHTFNTLHTAGKQIILGANCTPGELQHIEERLISRFEWGIVLPVEPMSDLDMLKVVEKKAAALDFPLASKVSRFIVDAFPSGTSSIIKALEALVLRSHMSKGEGKLSRAALTAPMAENLLSDLIQAEKKGALTPDKIIQTVAEFYGIRSEDVLSKSQSRECVLPRQMAMYLCRQKLKMAYMKIGDLFVRDHSTVMSSIRQIKKALEKEGSEIPAALNAVSKKL